MLIYNTDSKPNDYKDERSINEDDVVECFFADGTFTWGSWRTLADRRSARLEYEWWLCCEMDVANSIRFDGTN